MIFRIIIMNPIKKKLADFLYEMSKKRMEAIDQRSPCARTLKKMYRDGLLKKDIQRICDKVSVLEAVKIFSLYNKLMLSNTGDSDRYNKEIKSIASEVVKRVEKESGNLTPECLNLLMNLEDN